MHMAVHYRSAVGRLLPVIHQPVHFHPISNGIASFLDLKPLQNGLDLVLEPVVWV